jgi:prefoldin subunit 5
MHDHVSGAVAERDIERALDRLEYELQQELGSIRQAGEPLSEIERLSQRFEKKARWAEQAAAAQNRSATGNAATVDAAASTEGSNN